MAVPASLLTNGLRAFEVAVSDGCKPNQKNENVRKIHAKYSRLFNAFATCHKFIVILNVIRSYSLCVSLPATDVSITDKTGNISIPASFK